MCFVMTKKSEMGVGEGKAKRDGIGVYLQLIRAVVRQKPTQHCKAINHQLKIDLKNTAVSADYSKVS